MSAPSERANGQTNGPVLYASTSYAFYNVRKEGSVKTETVFANADKEFTFTFTKIFIETQKYQRYFMT